MNLPPSRELDILVATKVMGWEKLNNGSPVGWIDQDGDYMKKPDDIPNYSTDISAAWEVFEKMGDNFAIQRVKSKWIVFSGYHDWLAGESDSAPHAIALAALKAVGYNH